jgi:hypothetical protein
MFLGGIPLKNRLILHDQIISALKDIKASKEALQDANDMWEKGMCMVYFNIIRTAVEGQDKATKMKTTPSPEAIEVSKQLQGMLQFDKWQAPTPDQIQSLIESKGLMNEKLSLWISDYRHFVETGEISRRELLENWL